MSSPYPGVEIEPLLCSLLALSSEKAMVHSASHWFYHILSVNYLCLTSIKSHLNLLITILIPKQESIAIHVYFSWLDHLFLAIPSVTWQDCTAPQQTPPWVCTSEGKAGPVSLSACSHCVLQLAHWPFYPVWQEELSRHWTWGQKVSSQRHTRQGSTHAVLQEWWQWLTTQPAVTFQAPREAHSLQHMQSKSHSHQRSCSEMQNGAILSESRQ